MNPAQMFAVLALFFILPIAAWWFSARNQPDRVIEGGLDAVRQTVPAARGRVYQSTKAKLDEGLAAARSKAERIARRLAYLAQVWVDEGASFVAEHRLALGRWLLLFDFAAQTAITAVQHKEIDWFWYPLAGAGLAAVYAALGMMATWVIALLFRNRPPRGWAIVDGVALASGSGALLAAVALLLARGITDQATVAAIEVYADAVLSPLVVWGGFASGLLLGVASLQNEGIRLDREKRHVEREVATWEDGIRRLEELARELGVVATALLLLVFLPVHTAGGQSVTRPARMVRVAAVQTNEPTACAGLRDGSGSPDQGVLPMAIDSAMIIIRQQIKLARCTQFFAAVAASDTTWMPRQWFTLPEPPTSGGCSAAVKKAGVWGSMLQQVSPAADAGVKSDSLSRCAAVMQAATTAYDITLSARLSVIAAFLKSARVSTGRDTTGVVEILVFLGAERFATATLISDGVETKLHSIPNIALAHDVELILSPSQERYGGPARSVAGAADLARGIRGIRVVPYTDVSSYTPTVRSSAAVAGVRVVSRRH